MLVMRQVIKQRGSASDIRFRVAGNLVHRLSRSGLGSQVDHRANVSERRRPIGRLPDVSAKNFHLGVVQ